MHVGVTLAFNHHTPPQTAIGAAQHAEACGFHSLWVPEHVLFFRDYDAQYPYSDNGRIPGEPEGVLDPFSALTFVAGHTQTIRLGTGICIVPQRNPVYTAKMVADLDYLSGGRVDFGIGVGWMAEEFDALGVPFDDRGPRTDECLEAMKALWTQEAAAHDGERFRFSGALLNPKPVQQPHPPILVGGESRPALRRVARHGQGWYGFAHTPESLTGALAALDEALAAEGRSRDELLVYVSPKGRADGDTLRAFADAGVNQVIVPTMARDLDGFRKRMDALAEVAAQAA